MARRAANQAKMMLPDDLSPRNYLRRRNAKLASFLPSDQKMSWKSGNRHLAKQITGECQAGDGAATIIEIGKPGMFYRCMPNETGTAPTPAPRNWI